MISRVRLRHLFAACVSLLGSFACGAASGADGLAYPTRPIRVVLPFPPGGGTDTLARIITPKLSEALGQQWVVDNRAGAAGNIATEIVAKSAPDGHTVLIGFNTTLTVNPALYKDLPFNVLKDFAPITRLALARYLLVLHPSVAATSLRNS